MNNGPRRLAVLLIATLAVASVARAQEDDSDFQRRASLFAEKCAKCHTVGLGDRVGPDLKGVTERRERAWLVGFIRSPEAYFAGDATAQELLARYDNVKMPELGLTEAQAEDLLVHVETLSRGPAGMGAEDVLIPGVPRSAVVPVPEEGAGVESLCMALLVILGAGTALLWKTGRPRLAQVTAVLALSCAYGAFGGARYHRVVGVDQGYEPVQPVNFSHRLHAGELEVSCLYCHHGADRGAVAGIPPVSTCMNCHRIVRKRRDQKEPSAEIAKVIEAWESRDGESPRSIPWVRVHRLPDFVSFHHAAHVRNGIQCQECHGAVETMDRIRQSSDLTMGWCVNCHRHEGRQAPTHWQRATGELDCAVCHQ